MEESKVEGEVCPPQVSESPRCPGPDRAWRGAGAAVAEAPPGRQPLVGLSFHNAPAREATDKEWKLPRSGGRGKCGWNGRVHHIGNHAALVSSFTFSAE